MRCWWWKSFTKANRRTSCRAQREFFLLCDRVNPSVLPSITHNHIVIFKVGNDEKGKIYHPNPQTTVAKPVKTWQKSNLCQRAKFPLKLHLALVCCLERNSCLCELVQLIFSITTNPFYQLGNTKHVSVTNKDWVTSHQAPRFWLSAIQLQNLRISFT